MELSKADGLDITNLSKLSVRILNNGRRQKRINVLLGFYPDFYDAKAGCSLLRCAFVGYLNLNKDRLTVRF